MHRSSSDLFPEVLTHKQRQYAGDTILHCSGLPMKYWRVSGDTYILWNTHCNQTSTVFVALQFFSQ